MTEPGWRRAILGVALGSALLCLPFLGSYPLFDPDEGYYPAAAAESLAHGHPLDLTLNGEPRWEKPPLAYALMQVSFLLLGKNEFAARLPSVLDGAALVAILGLLVARVAGGRAGLLSAVVLASSLGHQVMSRAAHPEMALVLGTATAQLLFALWFVAPPGARPGWMWWAAGIAMGFGFLAKGPSVLAMPALMLLAGMLVLPREGRPGWGEVGRAFGGAAILCLALAAPWFVWMGNRHPEFWGKVLGFVADYSEREPDGFRASPFFFVPVLAVSFLPGLLFLPAGLRSLRRTDPSPAARFALLMALAAGTSFLFWSTSSAKNPHYSLVFLPPFAAIVGIRLGTSRADSPWRGLPAIVLGIAAFVPLAVLGTLHLLGTDIQNFMPSDADVPRDLARHLREEPGSGGSPVAVYRKRIPSMTFYAGRPVSRLRTPEELGRYLRSEGTRYLVYSLERFDLEQGEYPASEGPGWRLVGGPAGWHLWQLIRLDGPADLPLRDLPPPAPSGAPPEAGPR